MPAYQAAPYIEAAIHSVLAQDYDQWELLIVNDGSTDLTEDLITQFSDSRIRVFHQRNLGVSTARNKGLQHMSGDYFCFLDADDLMPKDSLSSRLNVFQDKQDEIDFVVGGQHQMNHDLSEILSVQLPSFQGNPRRALKRLDHTCFINCGTWMIKKRNDVTYEFPNGWSHAEDLAFFFSISKCGTLRSISTIAQIYRRNSDSAMSNMDGLVSGYMQFIQLIKLQKDSSLADIVYLKIKVLKITTLSLIDASMHSKIPSYFIKILLA